MRKINCYIPTSFVSDNLFGLVDDLFKYLGTKSKLQLSLKEISYLTTAVDKIASEGNHCLLMPTIEATYLEQKYNYIPLFKMGFSNLKSLLVCSQKSGITSLKQLEQKFIAVNKFEPWYITNPIIQYLLTNANITESMTEPNSKSADFNSLLEQLTENSIDAAIVTDRDLNSIAPDKKEAFLIIGEIPHITEINFLLYPKVKVNHYQKLKNISKYWIQNKTTLLRKYHLYIEFTQSVRSELLLEAIAALGYSLDEYISEKKNRYQTLACLRTTQIIKEMQEKLDRQTVFNEKLIKMYRQMKKDRDDLSETLTYAPDKYILFLTNGKIIGTSRSFNQSFGFNRRDLVNRGITDILTSDSSTSFNKLIDQIDHGLISSFTVKINRSEGQTVESKMYFSVMELENEKVILGRVINAK